MRSAVLVLVLGVTSCQSGFREVTENVVTEIQRACVAPGPDGPVFTMDFGACPRSECDTVVSAECRLLFVSPHELTIEGEAVIRSKERPVRGCPHDCNRVSADCTIDLEPGSYILSHGGATDVPFDVPGEQSGCTQI